MEYAETSRAKRERGRAEIRKLRPRAAEKPLAAKSEVLPDVTDPMGYVESQLPRYLARWEADIEAIQDPKDRSGEWHKLVRISRTFGRVRFDHGWDEPWKGQPPPALSHLTDEQLRAMERGEPIPELEEPGDDEEAPPIPGLVEPGED
ncbi:MAG: hypothetical protein ACREQY_16945 [Candidatus Binatia bacterium]